MNTKFGTFGGRSLIAKSLLGTVILLTGCGATINSTLPADSAGTSTLSPLSPSADASHILSGSKAYKDDGTVLTGTMSNLGALDVSQSFSGPGYVSSVTGLASTDICSSANFLGLAGTAVCVGAPTSLDASVSFVSGNYNAVTNAPAASSYLSTTTIFGTAGTMQTRTLSNASTTVNAGYYAATTLTAVDADLASSNIKSGVTIFGVAGSSSVVDTASGDAVAGDMLSGKKGYVNGALVTGTATNQGALNLNTTAIPGSSGGFYSSIALTLSASSVCVGTSIFGSAGSAACMALIDNRFNTLGTPGTKRKIPLAVGDVDTEARSSSDAFVDRTGWDATTCGTTSGASIDARIANCATVFGASSTWDGATKSNVGHGRFVLVARKGTNDEAWRDERTRLIWSSGLNSGRWCQAAGVGGPGSDDDLFCSDSGFQNQTNPESYCAEGTDNYGATLQSAVGLGEDWSTGVYANGKAGLGAHANAGAVQWRLPTVEDYLQAEANGIGFAVPNFQSGQYWTSTIKSDDSQYAFYYQPLNSAGMSVYYRYRDTDFMDVRCVGTN